MVVVEDADERPGVGSFVGEVHANILKALGCVGYATNGSVRDLPAMHKLGFQVFAAHVSVTHAYRHIVEFGEPVSVGGLMVASGDIVYGDCHGLLTIPENIVERLPATAEEMWKAEREVIALCQSPDFSVDRLRTVVREKE
jgi:regulator of RNase E activity RraA